MTAILFDRLVGDARYLAEFDAPGPCPTPFGGIIRAVGSGWNEVRVSTAAKIGRDRSKMRKVDPVEAIRANGLKCAEANVPRSFGRIEICLAGIQQ